MPPMNPWPSARPMSEPERIQRSVVGASFNRPILVFHLVPETAEAAPFLTSTPYHRQQAYDDTYGCALEFEENEAAMCAVVHENELFVGGGMICSAQLRVDKQVYDPELLGTKKFALHFPGRVIIKSALHPSEVERLRAEADVYSRLEESPHINVEGIPELVGFFCTEAQGRQQRAALVLSHAGIPVENPSSLPDGLKRAYLRILSTIHAAGWLHGKLTASKLFIDKGGEVRIVGLGDAQRLSSLESRAILERLEEKQELEAILGLRVITRAPVQSRVARLGPFHCELDRNNLEAIFRAQTACLQPMGYVPVRQALRFTLEVRQGKHYIAVEFTTRAEAELFLLRWKTVPIRDHSSALYAQLEE
ncbi:hypothetical protein DFH06DRAFT_1135736 [Mycena polygramma]|nr:hypothetical protein DFH06DRAFT_1135736 [Mycena polygramma]